MFKKIIAGAGIALVAFFAAPAAAQAVYGPDESVTVEGTPAPGETLTVSYDEIFIPGADVTFTLTGENATGATLAVFKAAVNTKTAVKAADASGSVAIDVTLPTNASGTYTLAATDGTTVAPAVSITVAAADGAGNGSGDDDGLAVTGGTAITTIWIAGGALALGAALLMIRSMRRKASV